MDKDKIQSLRWWILLLMGLAVMTTGLQNTMTNVGLPSLQSEFSADAATAQWFINSYVVAFAGVLLLAGALGDRYGRKLFLNLGLLTLGAGSLWATAATSSTEFLISQVAMGIGAAMLTPQTLSVLIDVFKQKERALAIAVWTGLAAMGAGLGPLVGGLLLENYSVNSLFYVNLPIIAVVLIFGWFLVPESKKAAKTGVDYVGALLSFLAVAALVTGFIWVPEHGWIGLYTLGAFLVAIVAGTFFAIYETTIKNPLLDMKYFKDSEFVDGVVGNMIVFFNLMGLFFLVTQFYQIVQQRSALEAGLLMLPMVVALALAAVVSQKIAAKYGSRRTMVFGILTVAAGMLLVGMWQADSNEWLTTIALTVVGIGGGLALTPATNDIMKKFTTKNAGMGSSVSVLARQVGGAIGIAVLGAVLSARYSDNLQAYVAGAPQEIADKITGSIHGAYELAMEFAQQGQQAIANSVVATVNSAFMVGLTIAMIVTVITTIVIAGYINRNTPKN